MLKEFFGKRILYWFHECAQFATYLFNALFPLCIPNILQQYFRQHNFNDLYKCTCKIAEFMRFSDYTDWGDNLI